MTKEQRDELLTAETELRGVLAELALITGPRGQVDSAATEKQIRVTRERLKHADGILEKALGAAV
jgi:hypothetical protein